MFEKADEVGGQNIIAGKAAGRQEITGVTRWLVGQLNKLELDIRLGAEATAEMVLKEQPDAVVIATGSSPKTAPFPGEYGPPQVVTTVQILTDAIEAGDKVLLIDQDGHHQATGTAEWLVGSRQAGSYDYRGALYRIGSGPPSGSLSHPQPACRKKG